MTRFKKTAFTCLCIFAATAAIRVIVWQNNLGDVDAALSGLSGAYRSDAKVLVSGDVREFLWGTDPPSDASPLAHPPGYPIFLAFANILSGGGDGTTLLQFLLASLGPVLVFLLMRHALDDRTAIVAAAFTALSPQIAYNSALLLPDSLAVLPIVAAVLFLIRYAGSKRIVDGIICGLLLALSCWLRPNALLLPPFIALVALALFERKVDAFRFAAVLIVAFLIGIAPITIRNAVGFRAFIPLSLGSGVTMLEGVADLDAGRVLNLPGTDAEVLQTEAVETNDPRYAGSLYDPDGIEREKARWRKATDAIKSRPDIYITGVTGRGLSFFRLERVPAIAYPLGQRRTADNVFHYPNIALVALQKPFITAVFLPLFILGVGLLAWNKSTRRSLLMLALVPLYLVCVQSFFHTEYRYVLALHYFELAIAAVPVAWVLAKLRPPSNADGLAGPE